MCIHACIHVQCCMYMYSFFLFFVIPDPLCLSQFASLICKIKALCETGLDDKTPVHV